MMTLEGRIILYIKSHGPSTIQAMARHLRGDSVEIRRTVWRMHAAGILDRMPGNNYRYYVRGCTA